MAKLVSVVFRVIRRTTWIALLLWLIPAALLPQQAHDPQLAAVEGRLGKVEEDLQKITGTKYGEILLDKGLLALVALLFGFVLSRALERYKREQAILQALGSRRADAIAEVLSLATQLDGAMNRLLELDPKNDAQKATQITDEAKRCAKLLVEKANEKMFLLGKYSELSYWFSQLQVLRMTGWYTGRLDSVKELEPDMQKLRKEMQRLFSSGPDVKLSLGVRYLLFMQRTGRAMAREKRAV